MAEDFSELEDLGQTLWRRNQGRTTQEDKIEEDLE